jgi:hypothetical protein
VFLSIEVFMKKDAHSEMPSQTPESRQALSLKMSRLVAQCNCPRWPHDNFMATQSSNVTDASQPKPSFNIVIVYDDFAGGRHAVETCSRLISEFKGDFTIRVKTWSFAVLRNPAVNVTAAFDAAKAQMVLVAVSSNDLPSAVKRWLETWTHWKSGRCQTLVGCLSAQEGKEDFLPAETYLRTSAAKGGMEFLLEKINHSGESRVFGVISQ